MNTNETQSRNSVQRIVLQRLLRKWRRMEKDYVKAVRHELGQCDKYASLRYEGESIALRWCCEDLEAALENAGDVARLGDGATSKGNTL